MAKLHRDLAGDTSMLSQMSRWPHAVWIIWKVDNVWPLPPLAPLVTFSPVVDGAPDGNEGTPLDRLRNGAGINRNVSVIIGTVQDEVGLARWVVFAGARAHACERAISLSYARR